MSDESQNGYSLFGHYINNSNKDKKKTNKISSTFGQRAAEKVASFVGSWKFIIIQSIFLLLWVILNICLIVYAWDPYPFILLNLFMSLQAGYTAPLILMAQNRQSAQDRSVLYSGWKIDQKMNNTITEMNYDVDGKLKCQDEKIDEILYILKKEKYKREE